MEHPHTQSKPPGCSLDGAGDPIPGPQFCVVGWGEALPPCPSSAGTVPAAGQQAFPEALPHGVTLCAGGGDLEGGPVERAAQAGGEQSRAQGWGRVA